LSHFQCSFFSTLTYYSQQTHAHIRLNPLSKINFRKRNKKCKTLNVIKQHLIAIVINNTMKNPTKVGLPLRRSVSTFLTSIRTFWPDRKFEFTEPPVSDREPTESRDWDSVLVEPRCLGMIFFPVKFSLP
jgi:hypothetical protein